MTPGEAAADGLPAAGPVWWESAPAIEPEPPDLEDAFDLVVVGAGFVGLSCAREAAATGLRVAVLERDVIGSGASSRNLGIVNGFAAIEVRRLVERLGRDRSVDVLAWLQGTVNGVVELSDRNLSVDLRHRNKKWIAVADAPKASLVETVELFEALGVGVTVDEGRGEIVAEIGSQVLVDPAGLVRAQAALARSLGAVVSERTNVAALTPGEPATVTLNDGRDLRARFVVVATNGFLDELTARGSVRPRVAPAIATRRLDQGAIASLPGYLREGHAAMDYGDSRFFARLLKGGRLIFGGARNKEEMRTTAPTNEACCPPTQVDRLRAELGRRFPALAEVELSTAWSGIVADTRSGLPVIRPCGRGVVAVSVCNGGGVALGSSAGHLVIPHLLRRPAPPAVASLLAASLLDR